jgi:hypothetical protein
VGAIGRSRTDHPDGGGRHRPTGYLVESIHVAPDGRRMA